MVKNMYISNDYDYINSESSTTMIPLSDIVNLLNNSSMKKLYLDWRNMLPSSINGEYVTFLYINTPGTYTLNMPTLDTLIVGANTNIIIGKCTPTTIVCIDTINFANIDNYVSNHEVHIYINPNSTCNTNATLFYTSNVDGYSKYVHPQYGLLYMHNDHNVGYIASYNDGHIIINNRDNVAAISGNNIHKHIGSNIKRLYLYDAKLYNRDLCWLHNIQELYMHNCIVIDAITSTLSTLNTIILDGATITMVDIIAPVIYVNKSPLPKLSNDYTYRQIDIISPIDSNAIIFKQLNDVAINNLSIIDIQCEMPMIVIDHELHDVVTLMPKYHGKDYKYNEHNFHATILYSVLSVIMILTILFDIIAAIVSQVWSSVNTIVGS